MTARALDRVANRARFSVFFAGAGLFALGGCTEVEKAEIGGAAEGEACTQPANCAAGFDCVGDDANKVCTKMDTGPAGPGRGSCCDAAKYAVANPAGTCGTPDVCPDPLVCGTQGVCTTTAGAAEGDPCGLSIDCGDTTLGVKMVCHGNDSKCVDPNNANAACGPCNYTIPAGSNFTQCKSDNVTPCFPNAGVNDLGESCAGITDCRRPYICGMASADPKCQKPPFFPGPDCSVSDDEAGWFRVYYEIPPETLASGGSLEFYRLPFPNDIRVNDGRISLAGHASPGDVMGIDVTGTIFNSIETEANGYAINSPIFFRLTDPPTNGSLCWDPGLGGRPDPPPKEDGSAGDPYCAGGGEPTIYLVDISTGSPTYLQRLPLQLSFTSARGQYACQNLLAVGPLDGAPLAHDTTYVVVITDGLRDVRGDPPIRDRAFEQIMNPTSTDFGPLLDQHVIDATQPLRDWIAADPSIGAAAAEKIVAATVFTTGDPDAIGPVLHQAVETLADNQTPSFNNDAFLCDNASAPLVPPLTGFFECHGIIAPFPGRSCPRDGTGITPAANFHEVHGTYNAPAFQIGERPYLTPANGNGSMDQVAPARFADEVMCYAMTIPKAPVTMPAGGWPVMIYGHGTGGNYRSFIEKDKTFSNGRSMTDLFTSWGFVVIGFDNVMHGPRQEKLVDPANGTAVLPADWIGLWLGAENLFFNVLNAKAARDNVLQGAVDLFYLTRLLQEVGLGNAAALTPSGLGGSVPINPDKIFYFGHSQGTTIAYPYLVEDTIVRAAILSGAGAELALSILGKKEPVNIADAAGAAFADQSLTRLHPIMGMLAHMFGPSDAVSWGQDVFFGRPGAGRSPLPLLLFSGIGDSYSPDSTQDALIRIMEIPEIVAGAVPTYPNISSGSSEVTAGVVRLSTDGTYDGHFVAFKNPDAEEPLRSFLQSMLEVTNGNRTHPEILR